MTQELATTTAEITADKIGAYLDAMGLASKLTPQEKTQFIEIAQAFGLNPFIREIYATKYGEGQYAKFSIIVGYEVYLKRAERSGQLAGWSATTTGSVEGKDLRGIVTIHRKDWNQPLIHEVYYSEYVQTTYDKSTNSQRPNKMWSEKPFTMIKKVAIAQGFRMAFSVDLGGIPYTSDEMPTLQEQAAQVTAQQAADAPAPAKMTRLESANAMKAHQEAAPAAVVDPIPDPVDDQFVFDRIDEYAFNIDKCEDDTSYDWNEEQIAADTSLPENERVALIKKSIIARTNLVTTMPQAEVVLKRLKGWAKFIGTDNVTALLGDLVAQAEANGVGYVNKAFVVPEQIVVPAPTA